MFNFADPKAICLRDYQSDAIEALRENVRRGIKRQILCASTGAGKTVMAAHLIDQARRKGSYCLFMVDRVDLVKQTSQSFDGFGIPHGIVQGINERWAPREDVQVCSVQTLARRSLPRRPDLFVYDEAHAQYRATLDFMAQFPDAVKIGLTATPFTKGMGEHWDAMVNARTARLLIEDGNLIEPTIYVARTPEDAELGLNSYGEFSDKSASDAGVKIIGDVVEEWRKKTLEHFGGPAKTIVFSPTVDHGRELCAAFSAAGYNFQQISYLDRSPADRDEKIAEFKRPDSMIHGLVSCGVLTKGFDAPDCLVGISCKPYRKSLSSHMQEIGRIMRPAPGKTKALWLCHSGNIERMAVDMFDVWENGAGDLSKAAKRDSTPRTRDQSTREKAVCPACNGALRGNDCTACGWERPSRSSVVAVDGVMQEFDPQALGLTARPGLRAECLKEPRKVWEAALAFCFERSSRGDDAARKWAYGIYRGIYPDSKLPTGWYGAPAPAGADQSAYALIERETRRFRTNNRRSMA